MIDYSVELERESKALRAARTRYFWYVSLAASVCGDDAVSFVYKKIGSERRCFITISGSKGASRLCVPRKTKQCASEWADKFAHIAESIGVTPQALPASDLRVLEQWRARCGNKG